MAVLVLLLLASVLAGFAATYLVFELVGVL